MTYIDSKKTRIWVHPTWRATDGAPNPVDAESLVSAGWAFLKGARSDQAQSTPNTQDTFHYGEEAAVTSSSPPNRTVTVPLSEDLSDEGQSIGRWAAQETETVGLLVLKDGENGYAVEATCVVNDESGDAGGGLRATGLIFTPLGQRVYVGVSGIYQPYS